MTYLLSTNQCVDSSGTVAVPGGRLGDGAPALPTDRGHYDSLRAGFAGCSLAWRLRAHIAQVASSATGGAPIAPSE